MGWTMLLDYAGGASWGWRDGSGWCFKVILKVLPLDSGICSCNEVCPGDCRLVTLLGTAFNMDFLEIVVSSFPAGKCLWMCGIAGAGIMGGAACLLCPDPLNDVCSGRPDCCIATANINCTAGPFCLLLGVTATAGTAVDPSVFWDGWRQCQSCVRVPATL